eukprot:6281506-Ditylum_brightwellii.AAC.1
MSSNRGRIALKLADNWALSIVAAVAILIGVTLPSVESRLWKRPSDGSALIFLNMELKASQLRVLPPPVGCAPLLVSFSPPP